ncbi:sugar ABC transporter permease [Plantactinospora sonchi]|uniref:Sugar ABC transporter permease n=1 Tax=Plantactinospora sonchi TaxID=1544735 RepID=A0ABU7RP33_9ACTN
MPHQPPVPPPARPATGGSVGRVLLGLGLVLPALLALVWSYLIPTVSIVLTSFRHEDLVKPPTPAGTENYQTIVADGVWGQIGSALLLGLLPLAYALVVAPLLAVVADRAGRVARLVTRAVLALPIAGYAPAALALGWRLHRIEPGEPGPLVLVDVLWALAATSFGLVVAIAATAFLSALRKRTSGRRSPAAVLTVGGVVGLSVLALTLQIYTTPALLNGLKTDGSALTPVVELLQNSFLLYRVGPGAAVATLLLGLLALLGLATTALLLATRTRIELDGWRDRRDTPPVPVSAQPAAGPEQPTAVPGQPDAVSARPTAVPGQPTVPAPTAVPAGGRGRLVHLGLLVVGLAALLGVVGWASAPWLRHILSDPGLDAFRNGQPEPGLSLVRVLANTWIPPLISAVVSVGLGAAGGFGIGGLRPLGRWSELLLVPFAPWLFVGVGPLSVGTATRAADADQVNTFLGLIPPVWLSVPALFVFTLLFRGQHARWRAGGGFFRALLLPALPMLPVALLLTWLFNAQQPYWARLMVSKAELLPAPVVAETMLWQFDEPDGDMLSLVLPLPILLIFLLAFVVLQVGYLDRLAIRVGRTTPPQGVGPAGAVAVPAGPVPPHGVAVPAQPYGVPAPPQQSGYPAPVPPQAYPPPHGYPPPQGYGPVAPQGGHPPPTSPYGG